MSEEKKSEKHEGRGEHEGKGKGKHKVKVKEYGKDHDKKRGLARADEAAGEHGKHGRDKARSKHGND